MKQFRLLKQQAGAYLFAGLLLATGCTKVNGDGPIVNETRTVSSFSGIRYSLQGNLHIEPGTENSIEIRAQQNIINVIETYVNNNTLQVRLRNNTVIHSYEPIEVRIKSPDPVSIQLDGSGNIWVPNTIEPATLTLESSGSGSIQLENLETAKLEARISGSGKIEVLHGTVGTERIQVSGSGHVLLGGILADSAFTQTSGSGQISVWVSRYLESEISGSGTVRYKGSPTVRKRVSGSGEVLPW
jgi:Putative auto-transporter adhesin, head GIN domain